MTQQIDPQLVNLSQAASAELGLSDKVILSQWVAENGNKLPPGYNFGNIRFDPSVPGAFYNGMVGTNSNGFVQYDTPQDGEEAYVQFMKDNSNYKDVIASVGKPVPDQLNAIINSPWDENHYTHKGQPYGQYLYDVYNSVTGENLPDTASSGDKKTVGVISVGDLPNQGGTDTQTVSGVVASKWKGWLGLPDSLTGTDMVIVLVGVVLIILLGYRMFTH